MPITRPRPRPRVVAASAVTALAVAAMSACGNSSSSTKTTTSSSAPSSGTPSSQAAPASTAPATGGSTSGTTSSLLGPDNKASGAPVKLGFSYAGASQSLDTTGELKGARAVVAYANAKLGGLGGRTIELVPCADQLDPAKAQDCANQFVSAKVLAVTSGSDPEVPVVAKVAAAAGLTYTADLATDASVLGSKTAYTFLNPLTPIAGPAILAKQEGYKRVAIFNIDTPASTAGIKMLAPPIYKNGGATVDVVSIPPGTADATPQVQAETSKKPDLIHIIGDPAFCGTVLKAVRTLGIKTPVTAIDSCLSATSNSSVPGGFAGVKVVATSNLDPASDGYKLFQAVMTTYGSASDLQTPSTALGFQGMLAFIRGVNASKPASLTASSVGAALKAMPVQPLPLGSGATYQCNGAAVASVSPAICTATGFLASADAAGKLSNYQPLNNPAIYSLKK